MVAASALGFSSLNASDRQRDAGASRQSDAGAGARKLERQNIGSVEAGEKAPGDGNELIKKVQSQDRPAAGDFE